MLTDKNKHLVRMRPYLFAGFPVFPRRLRYAGAYPSHGPSQRSTSLQANSLRFA